MKIKVYLRKEFTVINAHNTQKQTRFYSLLLISPPLQILCLSFPRFVPVVPISPRILPRLFDRTLSVDLVTSRPDLPPGEGHVGQHRVREPVSVPGRSVAQQAGWGMVLERILPVNWQIGSKGYLLLRGTRNINTAQHWSSNQPKVRPAIAEMNIDWRDTVSFSYLFRHVTISFLPFILVKT